MHSSHHRPNMHKAYKIAIITMPHAMSPYRALHLGVPYHFRQGYYSQSPLNNRLVHAWSSENSLSPPAASKTIWAKLHSCPIGGHQKTAVWKVDSVPCVQYVNEHTLRRDIAFWLMDVTFAVIMKVVQLRIRGPWVFLPSWQHPQSILIYVLVKAYCLWQVSA